MILYFLVAMSPLIIRSFFLNLNDNQKRKRNYLIFCGIVLVLFIGLRSKYVGSADSVNYYRMMQRALLCESWSEYYAPDFVESGFQFFVYCISRVFKSAQMLFVASAVVYIVSILYCIYKYSDNVVLSTIMYITLGLMQFNMQGMRQSLAMAICMFAFGFVKKKKFIPFLILVLLATQFHRTAIVFIAVYFIATLSYNWWTLFLLATGSVVIFSFTDQLMSFANDLFETDYAQTIDSGGFVATAIYVLIIVFAMLFNKKVKYEKDDKTQSSIMFLTIIGMVSYIMRYFGAGISERISFYFMFGQLLLLPNTISFFKEEKKMITAAVYVLCIALFLYRLRGSSFVPYEFFWSAL